MCNDNFGRFKMIELQFTCAMHAHIMVLDGTAEERGDAREDVMGSGPALCFLGPGAKPKLEARNKHKHPTSLYQLQS